MSHIITQCVTFGNGEIAEFANQFLKVIEQGSFQIVLAKCFFGCEAEELEHVVEVLEILQTLSAKSAGSSNGGVGNLRAIGRSTL